MKNDIDPYRIYILSVMAGLISAEIIRNWKKNIGAYHVKETFPNMAVFAGFQFSKYIFAAYLALTLFFVAYGQLATAQNASALQGKTPKEKAKLLTIMMKSKLSLDSLQLIQVEAINLNYALKNEPIIKSGDSKFSKFKQIKSSQKDKEEELKKVFTAEQYKQYQAFQQQMKAQLKEKRKER